VEKLETALGPLQEHLEIEEADDEAIERLGRLAAEQQHEAGAGYSGYANGASWPATNGAVPGPQGFNGDSGEHASTDGHANSHATASAPARTALPWQS
jgi:hypothetical protein